MTGYTEEVTKMLANVDQTIENGYPRITESMFKELVLPELTKDVMDYELMLNIFKRHNTPFFVTDDTTGKILFKAPGFLPPITRKSNVTDETFVAGARAVELALANNPDRAKSLTNSMFNNTLEIRVGGEFVKGWMDIFERYGIGPSDEKVSENTRAVTHDDCDDYD